MAERRTSWKKQYRREESERQRVAAVRASAMAGKRDPRIDPECGDIVEDRIVLAIFGDSLYHGEHRMNLYWRRESDPERDSVFAEKHTLFLSWRRWAKGKRVVHTVPMIPCSECGWQCLESWAGRKRPYVCENCIDAKEPFYDHFYDTIGRTGVFRSGVPVRR